MISIYLNKYLSCTKVFYNLTLLEHLLYHLPKVDYFDIILIQAYNFYFLNFPLN